ncbi:disease resistance protein At4g27190-like [Silene latifolia]|uniref:disease resistance protein At4g27190-like n=1 Tax=Silene latifolia TaxID=37657 RepID=UPI003D77C4F7
MTLVESIPRWMCKETFEKFTAISLMSGHDFSALSGVKAPLLEILLLKGDVSLTTIASDFFQGMKNLKVLSLSNVNFNMGLPESMGELERLKTLHLHHCKLKDVKLIGKLVNLLVLSLRGSTLEELAVEIGELCMLRLLDMGDCKGVKRIPANILSRLSNLEGLYMLNGFENWASTNIEVSNIEQLLTVNNGQLIEQLGKRKSKHRVKSVAKKTECLVLRDCSRLTKNVVPDLDEDGFKDLKYLKVENCKVKSVIHSDEHNEPMAFANLEILELIYMDFLEMIGEGKASVGVFSNLRRLKLSYLPSLKCGLSLTSILLNFNEVSVESCPALKFVAYKDAKYETQIDLFPCLKSLHLNSVSHLSSVLEQSETEVFALFNLEIMKMRSLGSPSMFAALVQLEELEISRCDHLQEVINKETEGDEILKKAINFPKLKCLSLKYCWKMERFYRGSYNLKFPNLKSLCLSNNGDFTNFDGSENSTTLFSDKIEFRCLEGLDVQEVSNEVLRLWNWSSSPV